MARKKIGIKNTSKANANRRPRDLAKNMQAKARKLKSLKRLVPSEYELVLHGTEWKLVPRTMN